MKFSGVDYIEYGFNDCNVLCSVCRIKVSDEYIASILRIEACAVQSSQKHLFCVLDRKVTQHRRSVCLPKYKYLRHERRCRRVTRRSDVTNSALFMKYSGTISACRSECILLTSSYLNEKEKRLTVYEA